MTAQKKGRPRFPENEGCNLFIRTALNEDEDRKFRRIAKERGKALSQLMREIFREWMAKQ